MMNVYFSIIIPAYKNLFLFKKSLLSVLQQDFVDYEVVVVDDSIDDYIMDFVCDVNDKRIKYYKNNPTKGAVKNWNYGITLAQGHYIILLHHDESFINHNYLKKCYELINKINCDIVISNVCVEFNSTNKKSNEKSIRIKKILCKYFPDILYIFNVVGPTATISVKREYINIFDENLVLLVDVDWYVNLIKNRNIGFLCGDGIHSVFGHKDQISLNIDRNMLRKKEEIYISNKYKYMRLIFPIRRAILILFGRVSSVKKIIWS